MSNSCDPVDSNPPGSSPRDSPGKNRESESHSVVSNSLQPHGLYSPWDSPGQNTGVDSHSLLQGIFPTQGSNPGLLSCWGLPEAPLQIAGGSPSTANGRHSGSPPTTWVLPWFKSWLKIETAICTGFLLFLTRNQVSNPSLF